MTRAILLSNEGKRIAHTIQEGMARKGQAIVVHPTDNLESAVKMMHGCDNVILVNTEYRIPDDQTDWEQIMIPNTNQSLISATSTRVPPKKYLGLFLKLLTEGNEALIPIVYYGAQRMAVPFTIGEPTDFKMQHAIKSFAGTLPYSLPKDADAFYERITEVVGKGR